MKLRTKWEGAFPGPAKDKAWKKWRNTSRCLVARVGEILPFECFSLVWEFSTAFASRDWAFPLEKCWAIFSMAYLFTIWKKLTQHFNQRDIFAFQFSSIESISTGLVDEFHLLRKRKPCLSLLICTTTFLLGLPCVTEVGCVWKAEIWMFMATIFFLLK